MEPKGVLSKLGSMNDHHWKLKKHNECSLDLSEIYDFIIIGYPLK